MAGLPRIVAESPRLFGVPCWYIPVLAGSAWLLTLLSLLLTWLSKGSPHYVEMQANQNLAYISDTGTSEWGKPLFIAGSAVTVFLFGITFAMERWLRHKGHLIHVSSRWGAVCSALASVFTIMGGTGLMLLTIFDARRHIKIHFPMIGVFIGGYILAAGFMAAEKKRISDRYPANIYLRRSFQIKYFFIILELIFTALFGVTALLAGHDIHSPHAGLRNPSVVVEWMIGFFFVFYMWSFAIDFLPVPQLVDADGEKVELVMDPEKLWDMEMSGDLQRPSTSWSRQSAKSVASTTKLLKVEHFQDSPNGTGQFRFNNARKENTLTLHLLWGIDEKTEGMFEFTQANRYLTFRDLGGCAIGNERDPTPTSASTPLRLTTNLRKRYLEDVLADWASVDDTRKHELRS